jgi:hypothetical protein
MSFRQGISDAAVRDIEQVLAHTQQQFDPQHHTKKTRISFAPHGPISPPTPIAPPPAVVPNCILTPAPTTALALAFMPGRFAIR